MTQGLPCDHAGASGCGNGLRIMSMGGSGDYRQRYSACHISVVHIIHTSLHFQLTHVDQSSNKVGQVHAGVSRCFEFMKPDVSIECLQVVGHPFGGRHACERT